MSMILSTGMPDNVSISTGVLCPYCLVNFLQEKFGGVVEKLDPGAKGP